MNEKAGKKNESVLAIINAINPIKQEVNLQFALLEKFIHYLSEILKSSEGFNISNIEPTKLYKLLQLLPTLNKFKNCNLK
jgi:hypothetical protein